MGRYYWSKKEEADSLKQVSVSFLRKHGYFNTGWYSGTITWSRNGKETGNINIQSFISNNEQYVKFIYTQTDNNTGEKKDLDYKIPLTTTPCYFGGKRYWFICPWHANGVYCGKRVGVLYLSGKYFACRHCHNLTYNSRNENRKYKHYPLFAVLDGYKKAEEIEKQIKRRFYAGKPTRKQRRLDRHYTRMLPYMIAVNKMKKDEAK